MQTKIICRKTRRPNDLCATENQRCKRCGALTAPASNKLKGANAEWVIVDEYHELEKHITG